MDSWVRENSFIKVDGLERTLEHLIY